MPNMPRRRIVNRLALALAVMIGCAGMPAASERHHRLSVDDVLDTVGIDQATTSPDGDLEAVSVQRPASDGEVFGRTAYEIDPSRNDVWIVSSRGGPARNLTNGKSAAAGYWCPTWSPDGKRLAMLSTRPEGGEPRGGDNVRLYLWDRTKDMIKRLDERPMVTQTRYGSPMYQLDLRDGSSQAISPKACRGYDENAPFVWLDDHRLLALTLPNGAVSGLLDQFGRPFAHTLATRDALRTGRSPTLTISESGSERPSDDGAMAPAQLRLFDVSTDTATTIADLPLYPFQGALTISISPDGKQAAIMASTAPLLPASGKRLPYNDDAWLVQKRLGFVAIAPGSDIRWVEVPPEARHPLELFAWSPASSRVAMRARGAPEDRVSTLFVVEASSSVVSTAGRGLEIVDPTADPYDHDPVAMWIDDEHLVVKARPAGGTRDDWWRIGPGNRQENVTSALSEPPAGWRRRGEAGLIGISGRMVAVLLKGDAMASTLRLPLLPKNTAFAIPSPNVGDRIVLASEGLKGQQVFSLLSTSTGRRKSSIEIPKTAELLESDDGALIWKEPRRTGLLLMRRAFGQGKAMKLLHLNQHLAEVSWGRIDLVDYVSIDGSSLKAAVILPPGYRSGRRYPVIVWTYGGFVVHDAENYFTDPYLPGIYNLQLYAARDYVVLIPSMPWKRDAARNDSYPWLPNGVLPAIDRLIQTGVADPNRVAVMGQSFGGYSVYSLITQTNRFKAAIAMAGVTDLTQVSYQFDPTARGYPGIEHQKSVNWSIIEISNGLGATPLDDPEIYRRNSPLSYVDRVNTPLLMIHGEYDIRGGSSHAETFFNALYRQKKAAKLLRYWGETHSLAQSPANIRSIVDEVLSWLSAHLKDSASAGRSSYVGN